MSRPTPPTYRTRNWPAYNEALKRRGSLTIWFDPEMSWDAAPTGRRGRQRTYRDAAIQTCLSMKVLFGLALRQTAGFVTGMMILVPKFGPESSDRGVCCEHPGQRHREHESAGRPMHSMSREFE